jgi:UDP-glucose:glycoprotein glucosyltransferase
MLSLTGGELNVRVSSEAARPDAPDRSGARPTWGGWISGDTAAGGGDDDGYVHVFSLASGALYERFLRIMMKSAAERCSKPIKFWVLGNFLSAAFRREITSGALEAAVGAKVHVVTYSWPSHLRYQSEKQRLIWGYKILFLDVLFPQHVKKVVYVDADQIVQGDLASLWNLDLEGRPIGMTPFCTRDENKLTTGFRFWTSGFWHGALRGRPYHISALFVVDLVAFRRQHADAYREAYQSLTADPNSLANLDQDLPNYLQSAVPIYSLPEEWLWCETWCGNASKVSAKTIDLCNNPLTKEPKLEQARRIGGERWATIDASLEEALRSPPAAAQAKEEL